MKVLVAGASGALGRQLVPRLVAAGHDVVGTMRSPSGLALMESYGARGITMDALDPDQVAKAVAEAAPEVIVHQLTAIGSIDMRHFDRSFALTNRLRTEGTDHLLSAAQAVGVSRFIAQSYTGWPYASTGGPIKTETDPLDENPPAPMRRTLAAIKHLEQAVLGVQWTDGVVLRYGGFYGPGTSLADGGEQAEAVRARKFPVVGNGAGIWSFVHVADAAEATLAAVTRARRGVYNVVDDEPAPVSEWLPVLAGQLGARPPMRIPAWLARIVAGEAAVRMLTEIRGASNAKAKRELGWQPAHRWRDGMST